MSHLSGIMCPMSRVMCRVSPVTCHLSLKLTATATDPPNSNSLIMQRENRKNKESAVAALEMKDAELADSIILNIEKDDEINMLKRTIDNMPTNSNGTNKLKSQIEVLKFNLKAATIFMDMNSIQLSDSEP